MEAIKTYFRNTQYLLYTALTGFVIFMFCYHGLGIGVKIFCILATVLIVSNIADIMIALVFGVMTASIFAIMPVEIPMFSTYWFRLGVADLIVFIQILLLIIYVTVNKKPVIAKDVFARPFVLYLIAVLLSLVFSQHKNAGMAMLFLLLTGYFFYRFILITLNSEKGIKILAVLCLTCLILTVMWAFANKPNFSSATTRSGISLETRAGYLFAGPNGLATILIILLPFSFLFFFIRNLVFKLLIIVVFFAGIYLLASTYSRNGYLSFLVSFIVMLILQIRKKSKPVLLGVFAICIVVLVISASTFQRFFSITVYQVDPSALLRFIMWRSALNEFFAHPLIGIGLGNFFFVTNLYNSGFAHNLLLNNLAETGILGGIAIVYFFIQVFSFLISIYRKITDKFMKTMNICLIGSWVAFSINNIFDQVCFFLDRTAEIKFFWLLLATTAVFVLQNKRTDKFEITT